jgi:hypothetical protein
MIETICVYEGIYLIGLVVSVPRIVFSPVKSDRQKNMCLAAASGVAVAAAKLLLVCWESRHMY